MIARLTAGLLALLFGAALPVAAQDAPAIIPVLASSELSQGPNRFLFGLTDAQGESVAGPDVSVRLEFYEGGAESPAFEAEARFLWAIEDVRGLYASDVDFPDAGPWGTRFYVAFPDGREAVSPPTDHPPLSYDVWETSSTPPIGAPAPAVVTPTAGDVGGDLSLISTDPEPDARLYQMSIADAVAADAPAIIAFATPGFCQSATCGPTLDKVKSVAREHPEVNVVHVEPYVMQVQDGTLQPQLSEEGWLQSAPWTESWGLRTEPFVVIVDRDGMVRNKFEGALTVDELDQALAAL